MHLSLASVSIIILSVLVAISSATYIYELDGSTNYLDKRFVWEEHRPDDGHGHKEVKHDFLSARDLGVEEGHIMTKRELCKGAQLDINKCHGFKRVKRNSLSSRQSGAGVVHRFSRRSFHHSGGKKCNHDTTV